MLAYEYRIVISSHVKNILADITVTHKSMIVKVAGTSIGFLPPDKKDAINKLYEVASSFHIKAQTHVRVEVQNVREGNWQLKALGIPESLLTTPQVLLRAISSIKETDGIALMSAIHQLN